MDGVSFLSDIPEWVVIVFFLGGFLAVTGVYFIKEKVSGWFK